MTEFESCLISINKNILLGNYDKIVPDSNVGYSLFDDLAFLKGLAISNNEKYRYIDFVMSMSNKFPFMISSFAFELYKNHEYDVATYAFLRMAQMSSKEKNDSSINNLVYILRRQESEYSSVFSISDLAELLEPGLKMHQPHCIVNLALLFILKSGNDEDWKLADEIIWTLNDSKENLNEIITWWSDVENVGTIECLVVHLLLLRNKLIEESTFGTKEEIIKKLKKEKFNIPKWI